VQCEVSHRNFGFYRNPSILMRLGEKTPAEAGK
jgi:hypothetical protein